MPEVSRFLGIFIRMYYNDHAPPHFHASYQRYNATFSISTGNLIKGKFPKKGEALVKAWAIMRKDKLMENWEELEAGNKPNKIDPLR